MLNLRDGIGVGHFINDDHRGDVPGNVELGDECQARGVSDILFDLQFRDLGGAVDVADVTREVNLALLPFLMPKLNAFKKCDRIQGIPPTN